MGLAGNANDGGAEVGMIEITTNDVSEYLLAALKTRADANGRTLDEEVTRIVKRRCLGQEHQI